MGNLPEDNRTRQIAIESFQQTLRMDKAQFDSGLYAYYEARNKFLTLIKFCVDYSERSNALINLIKEFGGETPEEYVDFKFEPVTLDNYESLISGQVNRHDAQGGDNNLDAIREDHEDRNNNTSDDNESIQKTPRKRGIKKRVIELFSASTAPLSTAWIVDMIRKEFGETTPYQSITNTLLRLQNGQYLSRTTDGDWDTIKRYDNEGNKLLSAHEFFADVIEDDEEQEGEPTNNEGTVSKD